MMHERIRRKKAYVAEKMKMVDVEDFLDSSPETYGNERKGKVLEITRIPQRYR